MNAAHLHLVVNHLPIAGMFFGSLVLLVSLLLRKKEMAMTGLGLVILAALLAIPALLTGEGAEEIVEELPEVSHRLIHAHEEAAETAFWLVEIIGAFALFSFWWLMKKDGYPFYLLLANLLFAAGVLFMLGQVGNTGGKIRHSEISYGVGKESSVASSWGTGMPTTQRSM
ncbi:MAG: hypothetical protein KatS3mg033_2377 [Thermonema sp.]|jgi:uncharacterized membrane protein|uniref:hypothetical protein n=1 Tax=Thermonema TaxID=28194 RepID=UPI00068D7A30|nr:MULTISPECIES: hypothetical protein [Thermonema]GIV40577.1 MAG: hypothetical protein KatS3mg033_2377 [Thermonema sp.]